MKKHFIPLKILFILFLSVSCSPKKQLSEALNDYSNIVHLDEVDPLENHRRIQLKFDDLIEELHKPDSQDQPINRLISDSLKSIYGEHLMMYEYLESHLQFLKDSVAIVDAETGKLLKKDETVLNLRYWMGNDPISNGGSGNGAGKDLHDVLDEYVDKISNFNEEIALKKKKTDWYKPDRLTDVDPRFSGKSWELYAFEGPVIANMATLEAMKYDLIQIMEAELDFYAKDLGLK